MDLHGRDEITKKGRECGGDGKKKIYYRVASGSFKMIIDLINYGSMESIIFLLL